MTTLIILIGYLIVGIIASCLIRINSDMLNDIEAGAIVLLWPGILGVIVVILISKVIGVFINKLLTGLRNEEK